MASTSAKHGIYLSHEEALETLPEYLKGNDEHEQNELAMFLSEVYQLHVHSDTSVSVSSAKSILDYVNHILELASGAAKQSVPPTVFYQFFDFTGKIATEIACKLINNVDIHNITLGVLTILKQFSWEVKVALVATTYILTFGDSGRNLCADSKLSVNKLPRFLELLLEITGCIVEFEKLPRIFMTTEDPQVKVARTQYIIAIYWIIKAVVINSTSRIVKKSRKGNRFSATASSTLQDEKLSAINGHLNSALLQLRKLLERDPDVEAYKQIKEIIDEENEDDNMKVLTVLFSANHNPPQLYDGSAKQMVYVDGLQGKYVLLFISSPIINSYEHDTIKMIYNKSRGTIAYEIIWIPVDLNDSVNPEYFNEDKFENLKASTPWYIHHPTTLKIGLKRFFEKDWNFKYEPIIVVLDPRGRVVNKNAMDMMLMWQNDAFPFTTAIEKTWWKRQTWGLDLLFHRIDDQKVSDWIHEEKHIFVYGGKRMEWIRSLISMAHELSIPIEMVYVGESNELGLLQNVRKALMVEGLISHCLSDYDSWYFWRRIEIIKHSMIQHEIYERALKEILRLDSHIESNAGWAILARGSGICLTGHGEVVLSTLNEKFEHLGRRNLNFLHQFATIYYRLLQKKFPVLQLRFRTPADKVLSTMTCPDCPEDMGNYTTFICNHPHGYSDYYLRNLFTRLSGMYLPSVADLEN